jgi:hypothetical protein
MSALGALLIGEVVTQPEHHFARVHEVVRLTASAGIACHSSDIAEHIFHQRLAA